MTHCYLTTAFCAVLQLSVSWVVTSICSHCSPFKLCPTRHDEFLRGKGKCLKENVRAVSRKNGIVGIGLEGMLKYYAVQLIGHIRGGKQ